MKLLYRTLAIIGAGLAFVASVALLVAKGDDEDPQEVDIEQHLLANRVTDLEHERDSLQEELARWHEAAMKADATAGEIRQENFRLSQEFKGVKAEATVASAKAERLARQLETAREEVDRLRRRLFTLQEQMPAAPPEPLSATQTPVEAIEAPIAPLPPSPILEEGTLSVVSLSQDRAVAALNYGRKRGAKKGQMLILHLGEGHTAKVMLTAVQADFSVALVISGATGPTNGLGAGKRFPFSPVD